MQQYDIAVLALRVVFGVFLAAHGYNKFFGGGRLAGTARWFGSMGMKWPKWQARIAATTEVGAGLMFAAGLLTPLAAAGIVGIMFVAIWTEHWKVGFFVFKPNQGWEYCMSILVVALVVATLPTSRWSLDHALDIEFKEWWGLVIAAGLGIGGGLAQLATSYRPPTKAAE
ncbi:MAG: DoxX family protein [Actinomycetota bacterium]|nr:DoxX family protein [Actinomycetota bacterium]